MSDADIDELIARGYEKGLIRATQDYVDAVVHSEISFICVGTPSAENGHLNLNYIYQTAKEIGEGIKNKKEICKLQLKAKKTIKLLLNKN